MTKKQIVLGVQALACVIVVQTFYLWKLERYTPYYGYYEKQELGVVNFLISLIVYALVFDVWFYVTHVVLHIPYFWRTVHKYHHEFREPAAFA
jgi:lathosterol oxidase